MSETFKNMEFIDEFIATRAEHVFINSERVKDIVDTVVSFINAYKDRDKFNDIAFKYSRLAVLDLPPTELIVDQLFVLNTLNFSLWDPKADEQWTVCEQTGYWALCCAVERAVDLEKPIWDPRYYSTITEDDFKIIFRSDNDAEIPLLHERIRILHNLGKLLLNNYEGSFVNVLKRCEHKAELIFHTLIEKFESYQDEAKYRNMQVILGTKALTLISDLHAYGHVTKYDPLKSTMFADYRVPMVLMRFEVIRYSDRLISLIEDRDEPLEHGSEEDLEIRCCSLAAIKQICNQTLRMCANFEELECVLNMPSCMSTIVDNFLWQHQTTYDNKLIALDVPFHYVKCVYY